jgi:uncharacterized OsmC-like protein
MYPIECVARGYLTGSGWAEYKNDQKVCGNDLPTGLQDGSQLPISIFTPATKAEIGDHDINIDFLAATKIVGSETATQLRDLTLAIYDFAAGIAQERGIILADTKFEFGTDAHGVMTLGDRALTRPYVITADEPQALLGRDSAPNPQELLLAALNACMAIDYVANAAAMGIEIDSMTIRSSGELDLRGFLGLDVAVNPGYDTVTVEVDIHSMAPPERLKELHTRVRRTSPNVNCFVRPINLDIRTRHYPFESCTAQRT